MQSDSNQQDFLFKKLSQIIDFNQDFENRVVVISSILRDLNALNDGSQKGFGWRNLFDDELASLNVTNETILRFHHKVLNFTTFEIKKLIVAPSVNLSTERIKCLFAIRGLIILWHLEHDRKIPSTLLNKLEVLFKAKNLETVTLIQNLSVDLKQLVNLNQQYPPTHKWFKFISTLIDCIQTVEIGPSLNRQTDSKSFLIEQKLIDTSSELTQLKNEVRNKKIYKPIHEAGDLLRYNFAGLNRLFRKDFSGIPNLFKHYHPDELRQFIPNIVKNFATHQDDVSLALLLCLILRCHVSRFHLVPLNPSCNSNIWLDLNHGFLVWNRQALIQSSDEIEPVNIPLPIEIVKSLIEKLQKSFNSKTLGDLFGNDLPNLKVQVRKLTFTKSISSHRPFVTRLHFSYGRFVLHICRDEVYAAAISVDFSLGVTANFNYVVLDPNRINKICEVVYKNLGFSGEFLNSVTTTVGSRQGQQVEKIINLLNGSLQNAKTIFEGVNNRSSLEQLVYVHNQIVFSLTFLIAVTCGLRKARHYSVCSHTLDLNNRLILLHDKASTEYLANRLVPIPEITLQWIIFYKNWLKSLAYRMSTKDKQFSNDIASICTNECCLGAIPFLFYFHRGEIKPIGSKHIHQFVKKEFLESNLGRHFLDRILRNSVGSTLLNAHAGRANLGQESFGMRSALSVTDAMRKLKEAIDSELEQLKILLPPQKQSVRYLSPGLTKTYHPPAWKKSSKKSNQSDLGEACPFGELTLLNAKNFEKLVSSWVSSTLKPGIGQLAISLTLMDGVFHEEEVLFALKELVQGRILKIENEYFIDVDTPAFGIRRINLSTITLCVLNSVFVSEAPESETVIRLLIENSISQLFIAVGLSAKNPLIALGEMAECFYSIRLPGTLREWMCGRRHARTLRPEALLRRHLQMRERLTDLGNFKQHARRIRSNQYLIDALNQACDKQNNFDSNVLRMKKLASVLEGLSGTFLSLADNVMVQYAWFLSTKCPKIKSPSSVRTHFYVIKPLVQNICLDIEELDELATIDWLEVSTTFLSDATDERKVASLNYLLRLFKQPEIKSLKKDEARSSRTYVDYPSTAEIELAINFIIKDINLSEYQMLAALMLKLMSHLPLRAEDVASLRICDVFIGELPFIVITSASTGSRKSENANRVLFLTDLDLIHQLKVLQQLRVSMSKVEQPTTSLFGSSEKLTSFEGTEELLSIISNALRCASGSSFVRPHSLRSKYLSEKFSEALMPKNTPSDALQQRNILYALATIAGHADPDVTVKNYVCDFNHIRRSWVDRLVLDGLKLSPNFIASVSTISYEAARKMLQRSSLIGDLIKNFQLGVTDQLKTRIFDMVQSHQLVDFEYALSTEKESVVLEIQAAQFLSCLLLGMERAAAAAYLNTPNLLPYEIESNLNIFIAYKGTKFFTKLRIDYERFKLGEGFVSLSQHFGLNINDSVHAAQLLRLIPLQMEKPWTVNIKDISFILEFIAPRLQCADFNLTVLIPDINSQENQERISQLYRLGVRRVEEKSRRNFSARDQLMILFRKTGISHQSNLDQKISNFEINIFMLSVLIKHKIQG